MALAKLGKEAVSFTGSQSGIITCENHSDARIVDVRPQRLEAVLEKGQIGIVAGFQGVSRKGEITTLGTGRFRYERCSSGCRFAGPKSGIL